MQADQALVDKDVIDPGPGHDVALAKVDLGVLVAVGETDLFSLDGIHIGTVPARSVAPVDFDVVYVRVLGREAHRGLMDGREGHRYEGTSAGWFGTLEGYQTSCCSGSSSVGRLTFVDGGGGGGGTDSHRRGGDGDGENPPSRRHRQQMCSLSLCQT